MAEQIPFSVVEHILVKLGSSAVQELGSMYGVRKELTKLKKKLGTINAVLLDAEEQQHKNHAIKNWVQRLKDNVYDADDLLDEFATHQLHQGGLTRQVSDFFSVSNQVAFRLKISTRVKNTTEALDDVANDITKFNFISRDTVHKPSENSGRETHSFILTSEIVGREENKEEISRLLVSPDNQEILSIVAIVGIGGLGKTALAQLVYNDERVAKYFELKMWVCVSDDFDVKMLVKKILKSISNEDVESLELNSLKDKLHEKLSQKRYLLVLDDVWNKNVKKWDDLRILLLVGAKGSKIIVTTRNTKVASIMGNNSPLILTDLKGLEENGSWDLFSKIAFREGLENVHSNLIKIGKEIAKICNGVPLIIKTLGTVLQFKSEERQWLSIKNNENLLSLQDENDDVLSVLKLSYDDLPTHLRQCFAYCALFPKNSEIEKKLLIQLWMAQGFIQPSNEKEHLEDIGGQYFEELLSRSLFHRVRKNAFNDILSCQMHDLIHDLAQSVIGTEVLILRDGVDDISERVHHVSLFGPLNLAMKALKAKSIRTLLVLSYHDCGDDPIVNMLLSNCKFLRVLRLDRMKIEKVPKSLGKLTHLRYLDLSHCIFKVLPNTLSRLKNLQTLKVVGCSNLKEFPRDMKELINLRHLENDRCGNLTHMPCGIGELTLLQNLSEFVVGNWKGRSRDHKIGSLSELIWLNQLRGKLCIKFLGNMRNVVLESRGHLKGKQYLQSLRLEWWDREANWGEDGELVMEGLQPHPNLKELSIEGYGGMRFPSWMMHDGLGLLLPNLVQIDIVGCPRCQILPPLSQLPCLKSLVLSGLEEAECMKECSSAPFFPSLQILKLYKMPKFKGLWSRDLPAEQDLSFPCLSQLEITCCNSLKSLLLPPLPCLLELRVKYCPVLTSLELHSFPCLSKLEIYNCYNLTSLRLHPYPCLSQFAITYCPNLISLELHSSPCLSYLCIKTCNNLQSFQLHSSSCLSSLEITSCPNLTSLKVPSLPCLEKLDLDTIRKDILRQLLSASCSIKYLHIWGIHDAISLPEEVLQYVHTLQTLTIARCSGLATLPDWIGSLAFLTHLQIHDCPELTSLPEEMCSLKNLQRLIFSYCPQLVERCQRETGEDWPKIAHVPEIHIY